jgi:hypothetical protein
MIHQFIFAGPKPGLTPEAFNSYWLNFHAVDFAAKIPQIRQYLVATRLPVSTGRDLPFFEGAAEIWLRNDAEQIASMQSPEFLLGARADEPRWAAFWQTLALDTDPQVLHNLSAPQPWPAFAKLYILMKRSPDLSLEAFRDALLAERRSADARLDGIVRHLVGFARAGLYGIGEPRFDAVEVLSFASAETLQAQLAGPLREPLHRGLSFVDDRYLFTFAAQEHWVIRPGEREG